MKFWLDTEFIEGGPRQPVRLISIGIVAEDGRELYIENLECDFRYANTWVVINVISRLQGIEFPRNDSGKLILTLPQVKAPEIALYFRFIGPKIIEFIGDDPTPEFWGYYADYDWVVFCQIFGTMMHLPRGKWRCDSCGNKPHNSDEPIPLRCLICGYDPEDRPAFTAVGKFPMFCLDIKQWAVMLGNPKLPEQTTTEHHALLDARWNREAWLFLDKLANNKS